MKNEFTIVDAGCLMYEDSKARWIIEHPVNGYLPTFSKMWDVLVEHPKYPHNNPIKFMGSFLKKNDAIDFIKNKISNNITYYNAVGVSSLFYKADYKKI